MVAEIPDDHGNAAGMAIGSRARHGGPQRLLRWGLYQWAAAATRRQLERRPIVVSALAVVVALFVFFFAERHGFFDLRVYYGALNYWVHDGGLLYDYLLPKTHYGFTYPPFAAIVMLPMAVTPWPVAIAISCVMCVTTTAIVLYWLVDPVARREGWIRWYALALALCLAAAFEPLRETFLFGQVNMLLLFLVALDLVLLVGRNSRFAGVAIGFATAIKLTPGIFILYLLITKRWRAAIVATATATAATLAAAAIAPRASLVFWTDALWNTNRVGALEFISNQSLNGAVARLDAADPSTALWLGGVIVILVIWIVRVRRAVACHDELTGFALTGIVGCLISPITWVHHLVWVGPAIVLLLDNAMAAGPSRRRRGLLAFMIVSYVLLCSRLVWSFTTEFEHPVGWFLSNAYVWISIALLVALPIRPRPVPARPPRRGASAQGAAEPGVAAPAAAFPVATGAAGRHPAAEVGAFDREVAGLLDGERAPSVAKPASLAERPGGGRQEA